MNLKDLLRPIRPIVAACSMVPPPRGELINS